MYKALRYLNMRIFLGVIMNHFGEVIRKIVLALRITFGRLRITFQMDCPKKPFFGPQPFFSQNIPFLGKFYV